VPAWAEKVIVKRTVVATARALADTKISEFDVAAPVYKNVVRLEVSMDVSVGVDCLKRQCQLGSVEGRRLLR
jgi:hypothetical protein